ncbi:MAG TPA: hypothetical protein VH107_21380 [Lacipirellulaceae bacterium]|nr:hypothetical protein [Lacipirellulaceae bacterium]
MYLRAFLALMTLSLCCNQLFAQTAPCVGDLLFLNLEGPLAAKYAALTLRNLNKPASALTVSIGGAVTRKLPNGKFEVESSTVIKSAGHPDRMITLTASVEPSKIITEPTPKGTLVYASPNSTGVPATQDMVSQSIRLADFKGLKLRSWKLDEEFGDQ